MASLIITLRVFASDFVERARSTYSSPMAVSYIPFSLHLFTFFYLFFFLNFETTTCDPRATEAALVCSKVTAPSSVRTAFVSNFVSSLDALTPQINDHGYAKVTINGTVNTTVFAFGECMKDLSQSDCNLCFAQAKIRIVSCLPFQLLTRGGRLFYDGCYIRYDQYDFFAEGLSSVDTTVCGNASSVGGNLTVFGNNAIELVKNLSAVAPKNGGFAVGSFNGSSNLLVYGLAQCWEFVNQSTCEECLNKAVTNISSCTPKEEGRVLNAGCYLRYSTQKFYYNSTATAVANGGNRLATALAATFGSLAFVLIVSFALFILRKKQLKKEKERKQLGALLATVNKSKLNFSYETLEKATNYFSNSNKLGQGGSGSVFKGILPDGKPVAIKRLFFNTRQWVDHFFNEVDLISGIHHKNLVKLLGCSIIGPESLLVYEFIPNGSLHDHIFGNRKSEPLQWGVRYSIILGTAEGLAHLHEESHARIIHRDIKLSNVLIDVDFTAKVADFGLARLFPEDKSHISTAIAGTLGYMAPEYVVRGKLTEKADVYSFGVLVIEVVSGKRSNSFSQNAVSILQTVWNLYGTGRLHEAVDPVLRGNFRQDEASRLLQIGLLCAQASAEMRPSMSMVVKMLTQNQEIPQPTQPPFLNTNSTELAPTFPPQIYNSQSQSQSSGNELTESFIEPR